MNSKNSFIKELKLHNWEIHDVRNLYNEKLQPHTCYKKRNILLIGQKHKIQPT